MKRINKKTLFISAAFTIAIALSLFFIFAQDQATLDSPSQEESINYDPPTEEQVKAGSENKEKIIEDELSQNQQNASNEPTDSTKEVDVVLTRAQTSENLLTVAGFAESSSEGECKLKLSSPETSTLEYTNETSFNPTNSNIVDCNTFRVPLSNLSASNSWTAQIEYSSEGLLGASNKMEVEL